MVFDINNCKCIFRECSLLQYLRGKVIVSLITDYCNYQIEIIAVLNINNNVMYVKELNTKVSAYTLSNVEKAFEV